MKLYECYAIYNIQQYIDLKIMYPYIEIEIIRSIAFRVLIKHKKQIQYKNENVVSST